MTESCETCKFWKDPPGETRPKGANRHAHCMRFPPTLLEGNVGTFPATAPHIWCGEYVGVPMEIAPAPEPVKAPEAPKPFFGMPLATPEPVKP